jgi:hypothetical protein
MVAIPSTEKRQFCRHIVNRNFQILCKFQLLLLAITIGAVICAIKSNDRLRWSHCWDFVGEFYSNTADWTHPDHIIIISAFVLTLTFLTSAMYWIGKKKPGKCQKTMASIGVTVKN